MLLLPSSMYKLTVMNMTTAAIEQTDTIFRAALILEWILISIGFGETMLLWYLLRYTRQYHRNLAMIVEQLPNQYFPSLIARMYMIYKQLTIPNTAELIQDESFLFAVWLRNSLLFVAFYFAPFPVIERCFATVYMQDYETKKRRWISYLLSTILYIIAFVSAQFFIFGSSCREIHIFLITGFNLLAFALTFIMERYNKKQYAVLRKNENSDYSLSVRAQLSENINSTLPFKVMCFSIAFFASLCTSMLHVDEWTESQTIRNWVYIAFNFSCWSYGTLVPFFMLAYNPLWQKELKRLIRKFCCFCIPNRVAADPELRKKKTQKVKDTFGNNCLVDDTEHTTIYFSQLNAEWNAPSESEKKCEKKKKKRDSNTTEGLSVPNQVSPRSISNGSIASRQELA
ncbi:hypothetical protein B9Z55_012932 [Caenorhabditis nigoni]|uniref:Uncharacterized protein n=1 Tax=Caenorhabditis nigoni TaxID=1611254 RepID=A0A2G5TZG4_9PELO|nr:hypothetical protein B9Z55_012932 [Caenorhabditis nigoni]